MTDKIAIVGSAPSSLGLTPFDDKSWAIWCCSPAVFAHAASKRSDAWFELHRWQPSEPGRSGAPGTKQWFSPEFALFLAQHKGPVYMSEPQPQIPTCTVYPYAEMIAEFGPYFFTSTIAWMLALAIKQNPKVIGLFGIDMAAQSEWAYQRPGCQHFIGVACAMGIQVVLPPESDLMRHSTLYGIGEHNPRHVKLSARLAEFEQRKAAVTNQLNAANAELHFINGAIDVTKYDLEVWTDDILPNPLHAVSFSGSYLKPAVTKVEEPVQPASTGAAVTALKDATG